MEKEIKKINSLDELNQLKIGSRILVADGGDMYAMERVFEGKEEGIYSFLKYDLKYPQGHLITSWKVRKEDISFKPSFKRAIKIMSHDCKSYSIEDKGHGDKLKLIMGRLN